MPEYLVFLQVAKKNLHFAMHSANLSALLEACNRGWGSKEVSVQLCLILEKYLLKLNFLKIFVYGQDCQLINKI